MKYIIFFSAFFISSIFCQSVRFNHLTDKGGLTHHAVTSIIQDYKGFIWLGTYGGLNRYDGNKVKQFKNEVNNPNSLKNNAIKYLYEDSNNDLWIGCYNGGLNKFIRDKEIFINYSNPFDSTNSGSLDNILAIVEDSTGLLWIASEGGLSSFDPQKGEYLDNYYDFVSTPQNVNTRHVFDVFLSKDNKLWMAMDSKVGAFDIETRSYTNYLNLPNFIASRIVQVDEETFWISSFRDGLIEYNYKTGKKIHYLSKMEVNGLRIHSDNIESLFRDGSNKLWIGSKDNGIAVLNLKTRELQYFKHENNNKFSLSNNYIFDFYKDRTNVFWIGTNNGVNIYDLNGKKFNSILFDQKFGDSSGEINVTSIQKDQQNNLWFSTLGIGLIKYNPFSGRYIQYNTNQDKSVLNVSNVIRSIFIDSKNNIWICTDGDGLHILNIDKNKLYTFSTYDYDTYIPENVFTIAYEDSRGNVWVGCWNGGLLKCNFENGELTYNQYLPDTADPYSISYKTISDIFEDSQGTLWIATKGGGLNKAIPGNDVNDLKFLHYQNVEGDSTSLPSDEVMVIHEDKNNTIWIGTNNGGICRYNKEDDNFTTYSTDKGIASYSISGITEDNNQNLWIATARGLSKFEINNETFQNYYYSDGLISNGFYENAFFKDDNDILYFGGSSGVTFFKADEITSNSFLPQAVITDFQVFNKSLEIDQEISGNVVLPKPISEMEEIKLTYNESVITIFFAALHFSAPGKNQFAYKMDGFDKDWRYTSSKKQFETYTNLDPGLYVFKVKASNNDGKWNDEETTLRIHITPPFWETWWFIILIIIIIAYFIITYFHYRTKSITEQNIVLEQAVKQKTNEMEKLMDKMVRQEKLATIGQVTGSIAHELRNPLSAALQSNYYLKNNLSGSSSRILKHLNIVEDEISMATKVIDDLMEITRLENIKKDQVNLKVLIKDSLKRSNLSENIKTDIKISSKQLEIWANYNQLRQVFVNLFINAKHAMEDVGVLSINIEQFSKKGFIQIKVLDNGPGIEKELLDKIFEPLFSTKTHGTGLGLSICKQIIEKHKGQISVISEEEKGTTIIIVLPIDQKI